MALISSSDIPNSNDISLSYWSSNIFVAISFYILSFSFCNLAYSFSTSSSFSSSSALSFWYTDFEPLPWSCMSSSSFLSIIWVWASFLCFFKSEFPYFLEPLVLFSDSWFKLVSATLFWEWPASFPKSKFSSLDGDLRAALPLVLRPSMMNSGTMSVFLRLFYFVEFYCLFNNSRWVDSSTSISSLRDWSSFCF